MTNTNQHEAFVVAPDDPLADAHAAVTAWVEEALNSLDPHEYYYDVDLKRLPSGRALLKATPEQARRFVLAAIEQVRKQDRLADVIRSEGGNNLSHARFDVRRRRWQTQGLLNALLRRALPFQEQDLIAILEWCEEAPFLGTALVPVGSITRTIERFVKEHSVSSSLRDSMRRFAERLEASHDRDARRFAAKVRELFHDETHIPLMSGEVWSDAALEECSTLDRAVQTAWGALLRHALTANAAKPSAKWLKEGNRLVVEVGDDAFRDGLSRWLPLVSRGRTHSDQARADTMIDENANCLRGLLWLIPTLPEADRDQLSRAITGVALSAYKKVPGIGPRAVKVGNAAVYALSELGTNEAVGQLALLKVRVKFGTAQNEIEKAFNVTAEALGLPRDQIEELGVPTYGLEEVGLRRETFGDYRAELVVTGSDAALHWFDAKEKALKSVPAKVKAEHKEDLKELQQALKDIQAMLPAQRDRIDGMFLLQKSWPIDEWRERYLDHPLVGTIARRLIWCVDETPALFLDGQATDVRGEPIADAEAATITLWHPVGRSIEEVTTWRRRLEAINLTQPFKQAHREVYLLTDAERNTRTYSNRYAAHVIRQHQFNALCAARGWKNKLRLMVDDTYPPATRELPNWGLRAEFWIEGIGDDYGVDTNDAGTYLRLATDQVRFYRMGASQNWVHAGGGSYHSNALGPGEGAINEPIPLDQVSPLVFSEIMRDVDLFVGVASVGNDPTWQDGGPEGRYRAYWQSYSFGELSGTASTRKQVLERLIPRLKIANRCSISDRFLMVRGDKRTYKIHLGSGNILMEPNDQYLCIVPDSRARAGQEDLFLPFEGDGVLSIILSKAFLLADDTKIKDPTITRQIEHR